VPDVARLVPKGVGAIAISLSEQLGDLSRARGIIDQLVLRAGMTAPQWAEHEASLSVHATSLAIADVAFERMTFART
jgi:hypothetical protein